LFETAKKTEPAPFHVDKKWFDPSTQVKVWILSDVPLPYDFNKKIMWAVTQEKESLHGSIDPMIKIILYGKEWAYFF